MLKCSLWLCLLLVLKCVQTARILCIFPSPLNSHQEVYRILTKALARKGHQLVVLTPLVQDGSVENVEEIKIHGQPYHDWETLIENTAKEQDPAVIPEEVLDFYYGHPQVHAIINDEILSFDVVLIESVELIGICARLKKPVAVLSVTGASDEAFNLVGAESNSYFCPNSSFWDRTIHYTQYLRTNLIKFLNKYDDKIYRNHFHQDFPALIDLKKNNLKMLILNTYCFWDNNIPIIPGTVLYMGAVQPLRPKALPKELEKYLNNSIHGAIYVSLGANLKMSTLPERTIRIILDALASLPYNILLKWDLDELLNKPRNVLVAKWFPQKDLLHHPNIKAFVTHAGVRSTGEAIAAKVPLLALPLFPEQIKTAEFYEKFGIGRTLDIKALDFFDLMNTIIEVAEEERYDENIKLLSDVMTDLRTGSIPAVVHYIEKLAVLGADHFLTSQYFHSEFERYFVDLFLLAAVAISITVLFIIIITKKVINYIKELTYAEQYKLM